MADTTVTIVGNLTRVPDLRFTQTGQATASFSVACSRKWKSGDEWKEQTSFFDVVCWGALAENVSASLDKGTRVIVTGRLDQQVWETAQGDKKRYKVVVTADDVGASLRWATVHVSKAERHERASTTPTPSAEDEPF